MSEYDFKRPLQQPDDLDLATEHNEALYASMKHAVQIGIASARRGGKYNTNYVKTYYETGVETGDIDIFWEDFQRIAKAAAAAFVDNGGEF